MWHPVTYSSLLPIASDNFFFEMSERADKWRGWFAAGLLQVPVRVELSSAFRVKAVGSKSGKSFGALNIISVDGCTISGELRVYFSGRITGVRRRAWSQVGAMLVEFDWPLGGDNSTTYENGRAFKGEAKRVSEVSEANDSMRITAPGKRAKSEIANYSNSLSSAERADIERVTGRWACRMPSMEGAPV